jgi:hypothetical protein
MELVISFPEQTSYSRSLILGELFRQALIEAGFSPDAHIYDLDQEYLRHKKQTASIRYLLDACAFYKTLPDFEQRVYVCQVLEYGRHFQFWWLLYTPNKWKYLRAYTAVLTKLDKFFR